MNILPLHFPVTSHTNYVGQGSTFVAVQGYKVDGVHFIMQALERGAKTIVVQEHADITADIHAALLLHGASLVRVENTRRALAQLSAKAAQFPAHKLRIIGVTGTKGKTSTAFLLEHMFRCAGYRTALIGTVKNSINGVDVAAELTTPQPDYLHQFLRVCVEQSVDIVIMEVAAQAFSLYRVDGIYFDIGVFTNFSQEHGEFYATMDAYFSAKRKILEHLKPHGHLLVNSDDAACKTLLAEPRVQGFSLHGQPHDMIACCEVTVNNVHYNFACPVLLGRFNAYNVLAAVQVGLLCGIDPATLQSALRTFPGVPGRLEQVMLPNGARGIIDYAHNPSSFEAVLSTLRAITPHLVVVFGCGGDRDAGKRPVMGAIAARYADLVVITSDNPRSEDACTISAQIIEGIDSSARNKVVVELDREQAIKCAYGHSAAGSIIALLGKGPDEYQQIGMITYPFSEKAILRSL